MHTDIMRNAKNCYTYIIRGNTVNRTPDVEAVFEFNGTRMGPAADGTRILAKHSGNIGKVYEIVRWVTLK